MDYLHKPDYGRVPAYLASAKASQINGSTQPPNRGLIQSPLHKQEEIKREDELLARFLQRQRHQQRHGGADKDEEQGEPSAASSGVVALVPEEERRALVEALKGKWDAANTAYQRTAHHNGRLQSSGARQRKEAQEQALQQLEADIELLERGGAAGGLYVRYDEKDGGMKKGQATGMGAGTAAA
jgi:hypothetical protein